MSEKLNLTPDERRDLIAALSDHAGYEKEGVQIAEERLGQVKRGEAKLVPFDEAMRSLGR